MIPGIIKQFKILKEWIKSNEVDGIYNVGITIQKDKY
jgi:hypothetical protein